MDSTFVNDMLSNTFEMYKNIQESALKVECIRRYPGYTFSPAGHLLECAFLTYFCDKAAESNYQDCTDKMVKDTFKDFMCHMKEEMKDKKELDENNAGKYAYADVIFVSFVRMFNMAAKYIGDYEGWPAKKIARTVLEHMLRYYNGYWETGKSEEEYFLRCLLTSECSDF